MALSLIINLAGIPTIIKPFFGDQFFWADRVEALGVGSGVRKLTVAALTDAFITATTDSKQINRAKLLGEQIRSVSLLWISENFFFHWSCVGGWRRSCNRVNLSRSRIRPILDKTAISRVSRARRRGRSGFRSS